MTNLKFLLFRSLRSPFKNKASASSRTSQDSDTGNEQFQLEMQTRGSNRLGSISGRRQPSLDKAVELQEASEDNKENNGSVTDQSCKSSPKMESKSGEMKKDAAKTKGRKIPMNSSELLNADPKKLANSLSPTSVSSAASGRGRKGSDMKYSSLANQIRVPSAKTISDRMLSTPSSASEHTNMSPATQKMMKEVDDAYLSSPIPKSYLKSKENKRGHSSSKEVESAYASSPISKSTKATKNKVTNSTKPSDTSQLNTTRKEQQVLERKFSNQSLSDGRSRSPASGVSALAVEREKQQRKQRLQTADNDKGVNGRKNLDKRTARLRYGDAFKADIMNYRAEKTHLNNGSNHADKLGSEIQDRAMNSNGISVFVRKRPLFGFEEDRGDYDVVSIDNTTQSLHDEVIVHNCFMHPDMQKMLMKLIRFPATAAFDEHCSDDAIYKHIAEPLVNNAAQGGTASILMFGQTGAGKSHTMSQIENRLAEGLFQMLDSSAGVTVQFVELCGSKECKDLLSTSTSTVQIRDNSDGSVELGNATTLEISTPDELVNAIQLAKSRRATEATDKNGVSSRSHAVCQLQIKTRKAKGVLTLLDLAGSERRHDTMYHDSQRQKESAEINASLWALKECVRARANKSSRIPYRSSNLTRILRESFEREDAKLSIIGCVAPNGSDTDHTIETLKTIASIVGTESTEEKHRQVIQSDTETKRKTVAKLPKAWTHEELKAFLTKNDMGSIKLTPRHNGATMMKLSVSQMKAQLKIEKEEAEKLFTQIRTENDRVSKAQRKERQRVAKARKGNMAL